MKNLTAAVLKSPNAPDVLRDLQKALHEEMRRRHDFGEWIDETLKAEFINGEAVVHSPVKRKHWQSSNFLSTLLSVYTTLHNLGTVGVEKVMIALTRNDYEPDIVFFSLAKAALFETNQMFFPAPDLVVEILSKKTANRDKGIKKEDYAAHGISEYWIIDPEKQLVEQFLLLQKTDTNYSQPSVFSIHDDIESRSVEGFKIPVRAIFEQEANAETLKSFF